MKKETWKDIFVQQTDCGKFWKELHKEEFDKHSFLDRSDALYICKKAQADAYENVIKKLDRKTDSKIIEMVEKLIENLWNTDDSAIGMMGFNGKKIKK